MDKVSTIGLDIAKSVFQVHGVDAAGAVLIRKRISRAKVLEYFGELPPCLVGIEACPSAHHWGRELQGLGHTVRLIPPSYVKAYLKRGKNDANDAAAICEAVTRPSMRFVPIKTKEPQTALMLHRARQLLVRQRTMLSNALRGHLAEYGHVVPQGPAHVNRLVALVEDPKSAVPESARGILQVLIRTLNALEEQLKELDGEIARRAKADPVARRLMTIPGIGRIAATAITALVPAPEGFRAGRDFAAWLGLVPRQMSTGDRTILGKISKRGNRYLRVLFVQAAWVVLVKPKSWERHGLKPWIEAAKKRLHHNVLAIALANKLARIAWSVLARGRDFEASKLRVA